VQIFSVLLDFSDRLEKNFVGIKRAVLHCHIQPYIILDDNATGTDVVQLCTGEHTVSAIVDQLAVKYGQEAPTVEHEVMTFLAALSERGLVQEAT